MRDVQRLLIVVAGHLNAKSSSLLADLSAEYCCFTKNDYPASAALQCYALRATARSLFAELGRRSNIVDCLIAQDQQSSAAVRRQ